MTDRSMLASDDTGAVGAEGAAGAADSGPGPELGGSLDAGLPLGAEEPPRAGYVLRVNGVDRPVSEAWIGESLLYVLRERLGLAGAKDGCEQGECGACSVQVDGQLVDACLVPAALAQGCEIHTVEGLSGVGAGDPSGVGDPTDVQRALACSGAVQCGFCTPGLVMALHDLLDRNHEPTDLEIRQALSGNLCRCTGYQGALNAARRVSAVRRAAAQAETQARRDAADVAQTAEEGRSAERTGEFALGGVPAQNRHGAGAGAGDPAATGEFPAAGRHGRGPAEGLPEAGFHDDGSYADGSYADGSYADGSYADGSYGEGSYEDGSRAEAGHTGEFAVVGGFPRDPARTGQFPAVGQEQDPSHTGQFPAIGQDPGQTGQFAAVPQTHGADPAATGEFPVAGAPAGAEDGAEAGGDEEPGRSRGPRSLGGLGLAAGLAAVAGMRAQAARDLAAQDAAGPEAHDPQQGRNGHLPPASPPRYDEMGDTMPEGLPAIPGQPERPGEPDPDGESSVYREAAPAGGGYGGGEYSVYPEDPYQQQAEVEADRTRQISGYHEVDPLFGPLDAVMGGGEGGEQHAPHPAEPGRTYAPDPYGMSSDPYQADPYRQNHGGDPGTIPQLHIPPGMWDYPQPPARQEPQQPAPEADGRPAPEDRA